MKPRSWLLRVSLSLAIVSCVAIVALNVLKIKQKIETLQANLQTQTVGRQTAESNLARTKSELTSTSVQLEKTRASLAEAMAEQQKAIATAESQSKRAQNLKAELTQLRQEHEVTSAKLARFEAAGLDAEQVLYAAKTLKELQKRLAATQARSKELEIKLARFQPRDSGTPVLPAGLKAKVLASDAKWHFVVLDAGENAGVLERGELLLSRNGKLLARARISSVHPDRCIADLLPGWELNEILEGDTAIPAPPQS